MFLPIPAVQRTNLITAPLADICTLPPHPIPTWTSSTSGSLPSSIRFWMRWLSCLAACSNCGRGMAGQARSMPVLLSSSG